MKTIMSVLAVGMAMTPTYQSEEQTTRRELGLAGGSLGMVVDDFTGKTTVFNPGTNAILGTVQGIAGVTGDCSITADGTRGFFTNAQSDLTVADLSPTPSTLTVTNNPAAISNRGPDTALSADRKFLVVRGDTFLGRHS